MAKFFKDFPQYDGQPRLNYLDDEIVNAEAPEEDENDYTDLQTLQKLFRETRNGLKSVLPDDYSDPEQEMKDQGYAPIDFNDPYVVEERKANSRKVLIALKDTVAKDVVFNRMANAIALKAGIKPEEAGYFSPFFDRSEFGATALQDSISKGTDLISNLTDKQIPAQKRAEMIKNRVNELVKAAVEMKVSEDDAEFSENFEKYMDYTYAMRGLKDLQKMAEACGVELDPKTLCAGEALAEFGEKFRKECMAQAEMIVDPAYVVLTEEVIGSDFSRYDDENRRKSLYVDGAMSVESSSDNVMAPSVALKILSMGLDPNQSFISLSKKGDFVTFDEYGKAIRGKEPLIVLDEKGNFKAYLEFREDGTSYEIPDVKSVDLDLSDDKNVEKFNDLFKDFQQQLKDNDSLFIKSSDEYKEIKERVEALTKYSVKYDSVDRPLTELAKICDTYLENSANKKELSDYALRRVETIQQLRRSIQVSLTTKNATKFLEKQKEKAL
ncbi:MAG: hypothetical protein MJ072_01810, partial [Clostridia bacterium]|nr:hypothetical protein [Clostridia bacterium]